MRRCEHGLARLLIGIDATLQLLTQCRIGERGALISALEVHRELFRMLRSPLGGAGTHLSEVVRSISIADDGQSKQKAGEGGYAAHS
jgi:hypothetical protein